MDSRTELPHLSLKYLFGIVAFCAVLAYCVSQVGFDNPLFWFALIASFVMSAAFVEAVRSESRQRRAVVPIAFMLLCLSAFCMMPMFSSLALLINCFLLFIAGIFFVARPTARRTTLYTVTMLCVASAFLVGLVPGQMAISGLTALRREFPKVSLANRLRYERRRREVESGVLAPKVATSLDKFESDLELMNSFRSYQFLQLHSRQYENFVRASGFGVGRFLRPNAFWLRRPPLKDIPFSSIGTGIAESPDSDEEQSAQIHWKGMFQLDYLEGNIEDLHASSQIDFLDPDGFGARTESAYEVIGFVEHGFHYPPVVGLADEKAWTIVRLELISLLKYDEPRAYVLDHLPRMDQIAGKDVPTRPLDDFETGALKQLWTSEDIVATEVGKNYRMMGSLRANSQCLSCHDANRGDLLGAFSYVLKKNFRHRITPQQ